MEMINKHAIELMRTETAKRERKKALSQQRCKPGYEYNEVIGRCVLPFGVKAETPGPAPLLDGPEMSTPSFTSSVDDAIRAEKYKRKSASAQKTAQASKVLGE